MELTFLGTSAGVPCKTRNVSAIVFNPMNNQPHLWLFDCGEGTQHQMLNTAFNPGKFNKIFITHLHGDHIFGLPGLLCSRSMAGIDAPLTIYGPQGIRRFTEMALQLSGSWTAFPLEVREIGEGEVFCDDEFRVTAFPLTHPVECYGYRIEQHDKPGALDASRLMAQGVPRGTIFQRLKRGETVCLEDGRVLNGKDYLGAPQPGKTLAIFGDTGPTPAGLALAKGVDVMVHEATLEAAMEEKANGRGHSTSVQAAALAKAAGVGRLVITHFSSRYDQTGCETLLNECRHIFPATVAAEDFLTVKI